MIKYIIKNKQWIFSGIGVFVLGGVIALFKFCGSSIPLVQYKHSIPSATNTKLLSQAEQIIMEIRSARPLQADEISKTYKDIPIDWHLFLVGGSSINESKYRLFLSPSLDSTILVICEISKSSGDKLRLLPKNAPIHIRGKIDRISGSTIDIKNTEILQ